MGKRLIDSTEEKWNRLKKINGSFSGNVSLQDNRFKIINWWYLTPNRIAKTFPEVKEMYWTCHEPRADFFHILWSCVKEENFWKGVNS